MVESLLSLAAALSFLFVLSFVLVYFQDGMVSTIDKYFSWVERVVERWKQ